LGEVPLATRAWNPLIAPQATVMNANGNSFPLKMGPVPSTNRVSAGMCISGRVIRIPAASAAMVPIFRKVLR
jgi:hypothetical protein